MTNECLFFVQHNSINSDRTPFGHTNLITEKTVTTRRGRVSSVRKNSRARRRRRRRRVSAFPATPPIRDERTNGHRTAARDVTRRIRAHARQTPVAVINIRLRRGRRRRHRGRRHAGAAARSYPPVPSRPLAPRRPRARSPRGHAHTHKHATTVRARIRRDTRYCCECGIFFFLFFFHSFYFPFSPPLRRRALCRSLALYRARSLSLSRRSRSLCRPVEVSA